MLTDDEIIRVLRYVSSWNPFAVWPGEFAVSWCHNRDLIYFSFWLGYQITPAGRAELDRLRKKAEVGDE